MAINVLTQPEPHVLSGNPVFVELQSTESHVNHRMHIRVIQFISGGDDLILANDSTLIVDGESAMFDIAVFLRRRYDQHCYTDSQVHFCDITLKYKITYFETHSFDGLVHNESEIGLFYAHEGKLDTEQLNVWEHNQDTFNSLIIHLEKAFLLDFSQRVANDAMNRAFVYLYLKGTGTYFIKTTLYYDQQYPYLDINQLALPQGLFAFPSGYNNYVKNIEQGRGAIPIYGFKYEITKEVFGSGKGTLLYSYTATVDRSYKRHSYQFYFKNRLGAFVSQVFHGENIEEVALKREIQSLVIKKQLSAVIEKNKQVSSEWLDIDEFNILVNQISFSKDVYIYENSRLKPIVIENTSVKKKSNEFLRKIELEFTYAETDSI